MEEHKINLITRVFVQPLTNFTNIPRRQDKYTSYLGSTFQVCLNNRIENKIVLLQGMGHRQKQELALAWQKLIRIIIEYMHQGFKQEYMQRGFKEEVIQQSNPKDGPVFK